MDTDNLPKRQAMFSSPSNSNVSLLSWSSSGSSESSISSSSSLLPDSLSDLDVELESASASLGTRSISGSDSVNKKSSKRRHRKHDFRLNMNKHDSVHAWISKITSAEEDYLDTVDDVIGGIGTGDRQRDSSTKACHSIMSLSNRNNLKFHQFHEEFKPEVPTSKSKRQAKKKLNICHWENCNTSYLHKDELCRHLKKHKTHNHDLTTFDGRNEEIEEPDAEGQQQDCKPDLFKCKYCSQTFAEISVLIDHSLTHRNKAFHSPLDTCKKSFLKNDQLGITKQRHHDQRRFKQKNCAKLFTLKRNFTENMKAIHLKSKRFKCNWKHCKKVFTKKINLVRHRKLHTGENLYRCLENGCGKSFTDRYLLRNHKRTHTGEKPYKCLEDGCGKSFTVCSSLNTHRRIHTGEKLHLCLVNGCGKSFYQLSYLNRHKRTHTGEKPYRCLEDGCGKCFAESGNFNAHRRIHTGEKPHRCSEDGCGKSFTQRSQLQIHKIRAHSVKNSK